MSDEKPTQDRPFGADTIDTIQRAVLHALVDHNRQRPWALEEIICEYNDISDQSDIEDALSYLRSAGLIRPIDGCYIATRAAVHVHTLGILSI